MKFVMLHFNWIIAVVLGTTSVLFIVWIPLGLYVLLSSILLCMAAFWRYSQKFIDTLQHIKQDQYSLVRINLEIAYKYQLSTSEITIINSLLNSEAPLKEIAYSIPMNYGTLRKNLSRVYQKLEINRREELYQKLYYTDCVEYIKVFSASPDREGWQRNESNTSTG